MELRVLGPLELVVDGRSVPLGGPKQRAVLATLAMARGAFVSVDSLTDQLWGGQPPARAIGSLQAYVSNLRRVLEPDRPARAASGVLVSSAHGYALRLGPGELDAERFERGAAEGRRLLLARQAGDAHRALVDALALWRDEVLADLDGERIGTAERARLTELRLAALEARIEADLALGDHAGAAAELERLVAEHPWRERFWGLLVLARYRAGRQAEALRAYQQARETLAEELGLGPSRQLQDLEAQVLAQDPALDWAPLPDLPPDNPPDRAPERRPAPDPLPEATSQPADGRGAGALVGRDDALDRLAMALADAVGGRRRVVLVSGPAGVGKTRLAEELDRRAVAEGAVVAWGRCPEGAGTPAFWPWIQIVRSVAAQLDPEARRRAAGDDAATLAPLVPWLAGDAAPPSAPPPSAPPSERDAVGALDADLARFTLYDSVSRFLARAGDARPLVLVLDDLHWADPSSVRLLHFLVEHVDASRTLLLGTYRDRDVAGVHPLADDVARLARAPGTERLALEGLDQGDVGRYLEHSLGIEVDPRVAATVHRRTGGNPFFMAELVRLLASEGRLDGDVASRAGTGVPLEVGDVIRRRVTRLPDDVVSVLTVAAVAGDVVRTDVLERACSLDLERLLDLLDIALVTGLLVEQPGAPGRYRFAHALVSEVLVGDLSAVQRARLHGRVAKAMEVLWRADPGPHLAELAHHFSAGAAGGTAREAVDHCRRAALAAVASLAHEQAVERWDDALSALDIADPDDLVTRYQLLMGLCDARRRAGDVAASLRALEAAMEVVVRTGDLDRIAGTSIGLGAGTLWSWRSYGVVDQAAIDRLERVIALLGDRDSALRSELQSALAVELLYAEGGSRGRALSQAALEMARRIGSPDLLASVLSMHYVANIGPTEPGRLLEISDEMVALPAAAPPEVRLAGRLLRMGSLLELGALDLVDADLDDAARAADALRQPALIAQFAWFRATRSLLAGRFDEAEARSADALARHQRTDLWGSMECYATQLFTLRRDQGRLSELEPLLDDLVASSEFDAFREGIALLYAELGRPDQAREVLRETARDGGWYRPLPKDWSWLFLTCVQAELCVELGDEAVAEELHADLAPHAGLLAVIGTGVACWGPVRYFLGRLDLLLGRADDAAVHLRAAVEVCDRLGAPVLAARARRRLGEAREAARCGAPAAGPR